MRRWGAYDNALEVSHRQVCSTEPGAHVLEGIPNGAPPRLDVTDGHYLNDFLFGIE